MQIKHFLNDHTYPIADDSSSVVPKALNITSSLGLLSPVYKADVPKITQNLTTFISKRATTDAFKSNLQ